MDTAKSAVAYEETTTSHVEKVPILFLLWVKNLTQEYIMYKDYGRFIRWQPSDENGVFPDRVRLDTGSDEGPRLMIFSNMYSMDKVRVLDGEIKRQFLELEAQIKALQTQRNQLIEANWDKMSALTWEYMKQHQEPSLSVPELYKHKNAITALRRGSKVMVNGSTEAVRWGIAGLVGRLKRKGKKWATVQFEERNEAASTSFFRLRYVPYTMLSPYDYQRWLAEKRRIPESKRLRKMSDQVTSALNKIL
jgi:hypothetical protein